MSNQIPYAFQQQIAALQAQLQQAQDQKFNNFAGQMRQEAATRAGKVEKQLSDLATIARSLDVRRESDDRIVRIEDIPGRRVPFDYLVDIPIAANDTSQREGTITISQEGPFVAVKRYAIFQSLYQFSVATGNTTTRFTGRTYGRWRPISSAWDLNDSQQQNGISTANPFPAGAFIANPELTSSTAGARSMQFDGKILLINEGSSFPRQNIAVPSAWWATGFTDPVDLGCLDFFERGEVMTFRVQPNHVNNPQGGNADGLGIFGSAGWPFLPGQFDKHEGIVTPNAFTATGGPPTNRLVADTITRLPDGVLTIGLMGYRIQQPPGV